MCGIFGQYTASGADRSLVERMSVRLSHRGPDGADIYENDAHTLVFGAGRLAIIDLSAPPGPIFNEDRSVTIVFNGEIYNYRALRDTLEGMGHRFRTHTDTEVIVHGYEAWGNAVLEQLNGMFAFCLYDQRADRMLLARDRLGEKPLYFTQAGDQFLFASEIKALFESPRVPRAVNTEALPVYLSLGYVPPPQTMFQQIEKLAPGECLVLEHGQIVVRNHYWEPTNHTAPRVSYPVAVQQVRQALEMAVESRMVSDVPVGAFLSGGLDSTAVTALMARYSRHPIQTFTAGFDFSAGSSADSKFNVDARFAEMAATTLKTDHHAVTIPVDARLAALLPALIYALDEPIAQQSILQTVMVAALARRLGVPVLLSGDAGDELFAGYPHYRLDRIVERYQQIPALVRSSVLDPLLGRSKRARKLIDKSQIATSTERYLTWMRMIDPARLPQITTNKEDAGAALNAVDTAIGHYLSRRTDGHFADRIAYTSLRLWVAEDSNMRVDKMTMAMSVEARAPLEDHRLVDLALGLPLDFKLRNGDFKRVFKDAVRELIPDPILRRPKWGFIPPTSEWLRTVFLPLVDQFLSEEAVARVGLFEPQVIAGLVKAHRAKTSYEVWSLWPLLVFHIWHALYISCELQTPEAHFTKDLIAGMVQV